jgi:U2 small nuclear ribonucleoprotein A'
VSRLPDYRLLVLHVLPRLRVLDWQKVKEKERKASREQYGVWVERKEDEEERLGTANKGKATQELNGTAAGNVKEEVSALAARMQQLIASIEQAGSLEEINALEQQLAELSQQQSRALQT